uniref:RRM domain-containing protein n=1 Tax=Trichuris muris TaxID=70415 RepID=A0A5S6QE93_TRIMR
MDMLNDSVANSVVDVAKEVKQTFRYLLGMHVVTYGMDGENLGADEAEIIYMGFAVVDPLQGKVNGIYEGYVQPSDQSKINWDQLAQRGINIELFRASMPLQKTISNLLAQVEECTKVPSNDLLLVTVGQPPLRQALHPEACNKRIRLDSLFWRFCDLCKVFQQLANNNQCFTSLSDIMNTYELEFTSGEFTCHNVAVDLGNVIARLAAEALKRGIDCFAEPESVKAVLEHGICTKDDVIDSSTVIRARGLPWQSSDQDIAQFFIGLNIAKGGVALCLSAQGRRNGEALVRFESSDHRELALKRHRHFMGNRYIEVYRATGEDFLSVAAGSNNEAQLFLSRESVVIIRMRGLPYDCSAKRILEFFESGENGVSVVDGENGILFVNKADGRATGDAFVLVSTEEDAQKALSKHKEIIGTRYIELFRSTTAEVQQVINKSLESVKMDLNSLPAVNILGGLQARASLPGAIGAALPALLPHQTFITGSRRDCIRLRGLPYEAEVSNVLEFLGDFSKNVAYQGVHMVFNAQGHPSGEAFIQLDSEAAAASAAADRHNKYLQIGKKQRYIEVFQCSADDMNLVLTGPAPIHSSLLPAAAALAAAQARPTLPAAGNGVLPSPALATALFSNQFGGYPFFPPQVWPGGAAPPIQNGTWTAVATAGNGTLPYILNPAARLPVISGVTNLFPTITAAPGAVVYWPYPSPPVSPTSYFTPAGQQAQVQGSNTVLLRGLPLNATAADVLNFFQGYPELTLDSVQIHRAASGQMTGDALVSFPNRVDAERAVIERNRQIMGNRPIDLYLCAM